MVVVERAIVDVNVTLDTGPSGFTFTMGIVALRMVAQVVVAVLVKCRRFLQAFRPVLADQIVALGIHSTTFG